MWQLHTQRCSLWLLALSWFYIFRLQVFEDSRLDVASALIYHTWFFFITFFSVWQSSRLLWAPCSEDPVAWVGSRPGLDQLFSPAALCLLLLGLSSFSLKEEGWLWGPWSAALSSYSQLCLVPCVGPLCHTQVLSTQISREPELEGEAGCEATASSHSICPCHVFLLYGETH